MVRGRVDANGLQGSWSGSAAEAFRGSLRELPGELGKVASAFGDAGQAVGSFASRLAEIQHEAAWYNRQIEGAKDEHGAALARQASVKAQLDDARLRHSLATDPVGLQTAKAAVDAGESAFRSAAADVEEIAGRVAKLVEGTVKLRSEYEQAVLSCCSTLDGVRSSGGRSFGAWLQAAVAGFVGAAQTAASWWLSNGRRLENAAGQIAQRADSLYGLVDDATQLVEQGIPVSMLGRWAVPLVRIANSPAFRFADRVAGPVNYVLLAYTAFDDAKTALTETGWENTPGRIFTTYATADSDLVLAWWPAAVANLASGGALSADIKGIGLIGGGLISGGIPGALRGDEQFANNAASGQYGGFVRDFAVDENFAIEHTGELPSAMLQGANEIAKGAWHDASNVAHGAWSEGKSLLNDL